MSCDTLYTNIQSINNVPARVAGTAPDNFGTLMGLIEAWHGHDDWGVCSLSLGTVVDLVTWLRQGDDKDALADHAKHVLTDCLRERCDLRIPACIQADKGFGERLKAGIEAIGRACNRPAGHEGGHGAFVQSDHDLQVAGWTWCLSA